MIENITVMKALTINNGGVALSLTLSGVPGVPACGSRVAGRVEETSRIASHNREQ